MVQFDNQYRQIKVKIVYYGPALGGKTTCLQQIHGVSDPERRTKLYSLNTASDRTLFFDLLSLDFGSIRGYRLAIQLYTVPGQVQYNATRRAVLSGADGVVFVADSQKDQLEANLESIENLSDNLIATGLHPDRVPLVIQFNKQDLSPLIPIETLESKINTRKVPAFPTVATQGTGVMEGFAAIAETTLVSVADKLGVGGRAEAVEKLRDQVRAALEPYLGATSSAEPASDIEVMRPDVAIDEDSPLKEEDLVGEAVRANLAMTDLNVRLDTMHRQLERKIEVLDGMAVFSEQVGTSKDPQGVLRMLLSTAAQLLKVQASSVLTVSGTGQLRPAALSAIKADPTIEVQDETGMPLADLVAATRKPLLIVEDSDVELAGRCFEAVSAAGFCSAVAAPMVARNEVIGLLLGYRKKDSRVLDDDDLQLVTVIAASAAQAFATVRTWKRLEELNLGLEAQVEARTNELNESFNEVKRLADELQDKNQLVEKAYGDLAELDRLKATLLGRISEELRSPVSSIHTAAKLLAENPETPPDKVSRFMTVIQDQAETLAGVVQTMFQASVLDSVRTSPEKECVPIRDFFKRVLAPLRDLADGRGVRMQVAMAGGLDTIWCDPEPMEAAIRALVKNGIVFNHEGGETRIEVRRVKKSETPWLRLQVVDSGPGIREEEIANVFEVFWQGSAAAEVGQHGIGLGLAVAKRVIENHGGQIEITNRDPKGTSVTVMLPED